MNPDLLCRDYWRDKYAEWFDEKQLHAKDLYLKRTYGITLADYYAILAHQKGMCAINGCGKVPVRSWLDVDHDHKARVVRGLLCRYHNHRLIGRHREWELLQAAANYLRWPPAVIAIGERSLMPKPKRKRRKSGSRKVS